MHVEKHFYRNFIVMRLLLFVCLFSTLKAGTGFVVRPLAQSRSTASSKSPVSVSLSAQLPKTGQEAIDELTPERRENLFQALLRDLQVEGTPLLGCDASEVHTLQAALWTTMAELSDQDDDQKACLVLESIPLPALQSFVNDFIVLKSQDRLMNCMPELKRINVSLVGKGVGPAILVEAAARTDEEKAEASKRRDVSEKLNKSNCMSAMRSFVDRVVIGYHACPYMTTAESASSGPVVYRYSPSSDASGALSSFWNNICELLSVPADELSSVVLSLPAIAPGTSGEAHKRFSAVTELISRSLCLYRGDDIFSLVHFHPGYQRDLIHPVEKPAYGQLPPQSWLRSMILMNGNKAEADELTDDQLQLSNYQRRAPHTAVNILRVSQLEDSTSPTSIVDLELPDGRVEKASGLATYSRNALRLAAEGKASLDAAVRADIAIQES